MTDAIEPVHVSAECWLYGERKGLIVVQEERAPSGKLLKTSQVTIPWDAIARARGRRSTK